MADHEEIDYRKKLKKLIDWFFKGLLILLNNKRLKIYKTTATLTNPKSPKGGYRGLCEYDLFDNGKLEKAIIYLRANKDEHPRGELGTTLIHELSHLLLPNTFEDRIEQLEIEEGKDNEEDLFLWNLFSKKQRQVIKSYIPRHSVKKKPE